MYRLLTASALTAVLTLSLLGNINPASAEDTAEKAAETTKTEAAKTIESIEKLAPTNAEQKALVDAATSYIHRVSYDKMFINRMLDTFLRHMDADKREKILSSISDNLDLKGMENETIKMLSKHYTLEEIQTMEKFYSSDTGKSIFEKTPAYTSDLLKHLMPMVMHSIQAARNEAMAPAASKEKMPKKSISE